MADLQQKLSGVGVQLRHWRPGNHKTLCPQCSHLRKKRKDPCLSVTIQTDRALLHCHNCGWGTAVFEDNDNGNKTVGEHYRLGKGQRSKRVDLGTARRRQRYGINAT